MFGKRKSAHGGGKAGGGKTKKKLGWTDYFSSRYSMQENDETTLGTFNYMQSKDDRNAF